MLFTICNILLFAVLFLLLIVLAQSWMYYIVYSIPGPKGDQGKCGPKGPRGPKGRVLGTNLESEAFADMRMLVQRYAKKKNECGEYMEQTELLSDGLFQIGADGKLEPRDLSKFQSQ